MSVGDPITIEKLDDNGEWQEYASIHAMKVNKTKSSEYVSAGGEQMAARVTFRVRFNSLLAPIEYDAPSYRLIWRGNTFDIRGYDDFMYQHRNVDLHCESYSVEV